MGAWGRKRCQVSHTTSELYRLVCSSVRKLVTLLVTLCFLYVVHKHWVTNFQITAPCDLGINTVTRMLPAESTAFCFPLIVSLL